MKAEPARAPEPETADPVNLHASRSRKIQRSRVDLFHSVQNLRNALVNLHRVSSELDSQPLQEAIYLLERGIQVLQSEHARIDFELLRTAPQSWTHPVQVIESPRAPFDQVAALFQQQLEQARGPEAELLQRIQERLERAHEIAENARQRRQIKLWSRSE